MAWDIDDPISTRQLREALKSEATESYPLFTIPPMPSPLRQSRQVNSPSPMPQPPSPDSDSSILALPAELLDQVLSLLSPAELTITSSTCRRLNDLASRDYRWEAFLNNAVATPLKSPSPFKTYKALYAAHYSHWFLSQHKLWLSDVYPHGKLLLARYDPRHGCIEAYALAAKPEPMRSINVLEWERDVAYQSFQPQTQLDLNQPVVRLQPNQTPTSDADSSRDGRDQPQKWTAETPMAIPNSFRHPLDNLTRVFMHARNLPPHLIDSRTSLWPPLSLPSPNGTRTRASTSTSYSSTGHKPSSFADSSTTTFRLRQKMNFHAANPLQPLLSAASTMTDGLLRERVDTFGTLDPKAYTPTPSKPYQGIFVGDYNSHGCEFLLVTQPDEEDARPLPRKARRALEKWPHATLWQALLADVPGEDDEVLDDDADIDDERYTVAASLPAALQLRQIRQARGEEMPEVMPGASPQQRERVRSGYAINSNMADGRAGVTKDVAPFKGRLEAVKLTGDPNVPRGELTFIADDLGERGLVAHTKETDFFESRDAAEGKLSASLVSRRKNKMRRQSSGDYTEIGEDDDACKGTRLVRSVGHISESTPARRESYIPSQLLLVSPDRLAQWWMPYQHVSFYERIDWERFLDVEADSSQIRGTSNK